MVYTRPRAPDWHRAREFLWLSHAVVNALPRAEFEHRWPAFFTGPIKATPKAPGRRIHILANDGE